MMTIRNHITLVGNIGSQTEVTNFPNGNKVARFSVATDTAYRANNGSLKKDTEWHRVFAWGNMAQFLESHAEKGKKVAIHGRLVDRTFVSKDGKAQHVKEIEVQHIIGL